MSWNCFFSFIRFTKKIVDDLKRCLPRIYVCEVTNCVNMLLDRSDEIVCEIGEIQFKIDSAKNYCVTTRKINQLLMNNMLLYQQSAFRRK